MKRSMGVCLTLLMLLQPLCLQADRGVALVSPKKFRDLMLIMDPSNQELNSGEVGVFTNTLETAVLEKAAPILISASVVENYLSIIKKGAPIANEILEVYTEYPSDDWEHGNRLQRSVKISAIKSKSAYLSAGVTPSADQAVLVGFQPNEWLIFKHTQSGLLLLIPKSYLSSFGNQPQEAGFNVNQASSSWAAVKAQSIEGIIEEIHTIKSSPDILAGIKSCLLGNKTNESQYQWNIYVGGHGGPALTKAQIAERLAKRENEIEKLNKVIKGLNETLKKSKDEATVKALAENQVHLAIVSANVAQNKKILASRSDAALMSTFSETATVAGIPFNTFINLVNFFDTINTSFMHYITCFGGGDNQAFVKSSLEKVNVDFLISSEGLGETSVSKLVTAGISFNLANYRYKIKPKQSYKLFFQRLRSFFGDPQQFVAADPISETLKESLVKDPIGKILSAICDYSNDEAISNQNYIRIPRVGVFSPLNYFNDVQLITKSVVMAAALEGKPIVINVPRAAEFFANRIPVPVELKQPDCKLIFLARTLIPQTPADKEQGQIISSGRVAMVFKEIEASTLWFQDFLKNAFEWNKTKLFLVLIEKLRCKTGTAFFTTPQGNTVTEFKNCQFVALIEDSGSVTINGDFTIGEGAQEQGYKISIAGKEGIEKALKETPNVINKPSSKLQAYISDYKKLIESLGGYTGKDITPEQIGSLGKILSERESQLKKAPQIMQQTTNALSSEIAETGKLSDQKTKEKKYKDIRQRIERLLAAGAIDQQGYNSLIAQLPKEAGKVPQPAKPPLPPLPAQPTKKPTPPPLPPLPSKPQAKPVPPSPAIPKPKQESIATIAARLKTVAVDQFPEEFDAIKRSRDEIIDLKNKLRTEVEAAFRARAEKLKVQMNVFRDFFPWLKTDRSFADFFRTAQPLAS